MKKALSLILALVLCLTLTLSGCEGLIAPPTTNPGEDNTDKEPPNDEKTAYTTHHMVGHAIRETIEKVGGTLPEKLPTPNKSIKEIEKGKLQEIK